MTREAVGSLLGLPGLGKARELPPPDDPPASTFLMVDIGMIDLCDLNPRQQKNEAFYAKIKESIRIAGVDIPIPITRRPGSARYMVAAGGNTRLKALMELNGEHPDGKKFQQAPCLFKPYTNDIAILAAHLRENDLRDDLVFIDHAMAIVNLRRMLEEQRRSDGGDGAAKGCKLEETEFEQILTEKMGHRTSRREIGRMQYAVSVLWPVIPKALQYGAGSRIVDSIGSLDSACTKVYHDILDNQPDLESRPEFGPLFADSLQVHDADTLNLDTVKDELVRRISQYTNTPQNHVRLALDEQLSTRLPRTDLKPQPKPIRAAAPKPTPVNAAGRGQTPPVSGKNAGSPSAIDAPSLAGSEPSQPPVLAEPATDEPAKANDWETIWADEEKSGVRQPDFQAIDLTTPRHHVSDDSVLHHETNVVGLTQQDTTAAPLGLDAIAGVDAFPESDDFLVIEPSYPIPDLASSDLPPFANGEEAGHEGQDESEDTFNDTDAMHSALPGLIFSPAPKAVASTSSAFPASQPLGLTSEDFHSLPACEIPPAGVFPSPSIPSFAEPARAHASQDSHEIQRPDALDPQRRQIAANATLLIHEAGVTGLRAVPDQRAAGGFTVLAQKPAASDKEGTLWWFLDALSGAAEEPAAQPSTHSLIRQLFLQFDDGSPPSGQVLMRLFQLIESVVAYARAADPRGEGGTALHRDQGRGNKR